VHGCSGWPDLGCNSNADCADIDVGTCTTFGNTRCSGNFTKLCATNADCAAADFGTCDAATCSAAGFGVFPQPNACDDALCTDGGGGEAHCTTGPDDRFCDGVLKADGSGIVSCVGNSDCSSGILGFAAGSCTRVERRACFADPIVATGAADPVEPLVAATFCMAPTAGAGQNTSIGLPGPARVLSQTTLTSYCSNDSVYSPGSGGCP